MLDDVSTSNNSGSSSDSTAIIGGAVGGVILMLMITAVLCIVILCVRRCHQKIDYNKTELNTDVALHPNPAYDVAKADMVDSLYSGIRQGDLDVPITANPSYHIPTKLYSKTSEDEYNYVQPNEFKQHLGRIVKMTTNPSYGVTT